MSEADHLLLLSPHAVPGAGGDRPAQTHALERGEACQRALQGKLSRQHRVVSPARSPPPAATAPPQGVEARFPPYPISVSSSYFLCYEDVLSTLMQADGNVQGCDKERVWSIGLWVPVFPGPDTDDIFEWYPLKSLISKLNSLNVQRRLSAHQLRSQLCKLGVSKVSVCVCGGGTFTEHKSR